MQTFQSEIGTLGRVLIKSARDAFVDDAQIDRQWRQLNYYERPDLRAAATEHDSFARQLAAAGAEVVGLAPDDRTGLDSLYPRDAAVVCQRGAILCRMGKPDRRGEPGAIGAALEAAGMPVCGQIDGPGLLEGGDVVWLRERIVAVGLGYRTNAQGIEQLRRLLDGLVDEFIVVPLPHWRGPQDVFHLMSMISPVDATLAAVYSPLLPVAFRERLLELGFALVEVPAAEFESQGCNILALAPRRVLMLDGNPLTRSRLEQAGVTVQTYCGAEISLKGGGGPTCLTRPLERQL